jgi:DNA-binding transcriptional MerR regulator
MKAARSAGRYPIRAAARLTGLGVDTLRAWERRYHAVTPVRDARGRTYTDADIARLRLLQAAVAAGHSIGRIASLSEPALRRLTAADVPAAAALPPALGTSTLRDAVRALDAARVEHEFWRLATVLPAADFVRSVMLPALRQAGDGWPGRPGAIAEEHLISSVLRHLLGSFLRVYAHRHLPARLLFTTPAGERHELGTLAAAMLAANAAVGNSYLGPDLPAREIVAAVRASGARVLVLGITLSDPATLFERDLREIRRALPHRVELWLAGPGAPAYSALARPGTLILDDFDGYIEQLARFSERAA